MELGWLVYPLSQTAQMTPEFLIVLSVLFIVTDNS